MSSPVPPDAWRLFGLCAQWCGTCREWRALFEAQARALPQVHFTWVDVEDEADALGDLDIETFPTLLIAHGSTIRFLGAIPPTAPAMTRLLESLQSDPRAASVPVEAQGLLARLDAVGLPRL